MSQELYEQYKQIGIDYNFYGTWQEKYGKLVVSLSDVLPKTQKASLTLLDVGTACGVNLLGIKKTGVFKRVVGVDSNEFFINLGKQTHGFTEEELRCISAQDLLSHFVPGEFDMIHCAQTLEHIPEKDIPKILKTFSKLLSPDGVVLIVVDAVNQHQTEQYVLSKDPTHITAKSSKWWLEKFNVYFKQDNRAVLKFAHIKHGPDGTGKTFYDYYKNEWTILTGQIK